MASRFPEHYTIFGDSDSETGSDRELDSDLDFSGLESADSDSEQGESESGSESESDEDEALEWTNQLKPIVVEEFNSPTGRTFQLPNNAREVDVFDSLFDEDILAKIVAETIRYAYQKLAMNQQRLENWKDTTATEMKAYLGVSIVMGLNSLPCTADYWSSDPFFGNEGIKKVMTKNRFEELS